MTFRSTFARTLGHNVAAVLVLAVVVMLSLAGADKPSTTRPAAVGSAAELAEAHGCSHAVQDPTHAIVTVDGVVRYVGQRMTDRAIEQVAFGVDHGLTVHTFCP